MPTSASPPPHRPPLALDDVARRYLDGLRDSAQAAAAVLRVESLDLELGVGDVAQLEFLRDAVRSPGEGGIRTDEVVAAGDVGLHMLVLSVPGAQVALSRRRVFSAAERRLLTFTAQVGLDVLITANGDAASHVDLHWPVGARHEPIEVALDRALHEDRMHLVYQPEFELRTGRVLALEALLRWDDDELAAQRLDEVILLAEATGRMAALGRWVLSSALAQLSHWQATLPPFSWSMAVNVSASQLDDEFVARLRRDLAEAGIEPTRLCLEITEHASRQDYPGLEARLDDLRALGVQLALDDVGTGHNSLSRIADTPLDVLKIDRSFVAGMLTSPSHRAVVDSIVWLGRELHLDVIAEGVETADEAQALVAAGCERAQGFLLCRPSRAEQLTPLLQTGALAQPELQALGLVG